ncbi:MAG TPA: class I SAM-dependent methyltransferase [Parvularculaceae bacterium]|nr:class I SAM-dependent methyltransferase [Amphiplicatus sp.]MCB9954346.1 class I SAM-dependent methyltransferase [Caulobacterales bacterium]HPE32189.1 class I SAM-dependent methyltransferase [Parvularculaceae bacterium]HRX39156.1 class I SAM-dependent methyltransferase [Parvularculaceae bacterium]
MLDSKYESLSRLAARQIELAPEQEKFFRKRLGDLSERELQAMNELGGHIEKLIAGRADEFLQDYVWLCAEQLEEELYFRRNNSYRLKTFAEAYEQVYSNKEYMTRYMNGLLMTQLWWKNHFDVIDYYRNAFLATNPKGYRHLEIGPGHGLFIYFAAADSNAGSVNGWDISEASIASTREALQVLGLKTLPKLQLQNLFEEPQGEFDSIVFSEVLEHMETPREALEVIQGLLAPKGRLFLNMPINSPAPDHLFNVESPEALASFVEGAGLKIVDKSYFPATNQTLELALKKKLTISCAFIAERA